MWEDRAYRVRREISALAAAGLGVGELYDAAISLVDNAVRTDLTCWAAIDPETLVISTMVSGATRIPTIYEPRLAEAEYSADEPHTFAALARRGEPTARLSDLPERERHRSARLNHVWRPLGLDRELRALFLADGVCWGAAGMVRAGPDFTDRETEFLAAVGPAIAAATRLAVRAEAHRSASPGGPPAPPGSRTGSAGPAGSASVPGPVGAVAAHPAIVVVGPGGELRAITPAAREWQDGLDEIAPGRFLVMMQVVAVGARSAESDGFRARVRDARGRWAVLHASRLIGEGDDEIAVAITPASGDQLIGLLLAAYGLTARERDVCREVIAGHPTTGIADRLFISAHTVQDHLKSVFAKVGVRSRGELVARLR